MALMHHKEHWDDLLQIAHSTMRSLYDLSGVNDETNLVFRPLPGEVLNKSMLISNARWSDKLQWIAARKYRSKQ